MGESCPEIQSQAFHLRLSTIDGIESLVQEEPDRPTKIHPSRAVLVEGGIVPQQRQDVDYDEQESRQSNQIGSHAHGKQLNDEIVVKRLEDVLGRQRPIDRGVLVLLERRKLVMSEIDHLGRYGRAAAEEDGKSVFSGSIVGGELTGVPYYVSSQWVDRVELLQS